MPPKKRPKGLLPVAKVGRPLGRRSNCREVEVQTDAELGALLGGLAADHRGKVDSAVLLRRQNILMIQLRKVSKQNQEMKAVIAKYQHIPNFLQAIKVHYESTFCSIRDDIASLVSEQQNRERKLMDHLRNQKCSIERLIATKDEKYKTKEEKYKALKAEKKLLNENLGLLQEALELEQRRVQVAVKEQCNALDEALEIRQRMEDKLFLAGNQRCGTCQTRERVQDELTDQIADKLHKIEVLHCQLKEKDDEIAKQRRINQMLISDLEKKRGELKDKSFAATSYQSELAKQQKKLRQVQAELQQLRVLNTNMANERQPNPHILTPPEEETDNEPKFAAFPCTKTTTTTKGRNEQQQQQSVKKNAPPSIGRRTIVNNSTGNTVGEGAGQSAHCQQQTAKARMNSSESELAVPASVAKRPRIVQPTNDGDSDGNKNTNGDGKTESIGFAAGGKAPNRRQGEAGTERFFSPPPLKRRDSNHALAPASTQQQQQKRMAAQPTNFEDIGHQKLTKTQQPQGGIASKVWRPTTENKPPPIQKSQQSFAVQMHNHQQQQHQSNHLPVGPSTATKTAMPTSQPSFFFASNNSANLSANNASFRKCDGATIDDFCGGQMGMNISSSIHNNNRKGRTPPPVVGGGAAMSGTWRKSLPDKFFMNRPADTHRDGFGSQQQMREHNVQEVRMTIAPSRPFGAPANSVAALPPMYACQQQNFPPPRPSAPIPRPPIQTFGQQTFIHPQQNGGGGTLPWHSQSFGTFPCTTPQLSLRGAVPQFFNR